MIILFQPIARPCVVPRAIWEWDLKSSIYTNQWYPQLHIPFGPIWQNPHNFPTQKEGFSPHPIRPPFSSIQFAPIWSVARIYSTRLPTEFIIRIFACDFICFDGFISTRSIIISFFSPFFDYLKKKVFS